MKWMTQALFCACTLFCALSACGTKSQPDPSEPSHAVLQTAKRTNVLLVTLDTTRADRLGSYGFPFARTPHLDRLAREGVRASHAIASAPITAPSHASILSGLYPPAHGVRDNGSYRLPDEVVTLPEVLAQAGYETRAFVSALVLHRRYNLAQGFQDYDDELWGEDTPKKFMIRERPGKRTVDRVLTWLDDWKAERSQTPFFAWVHLFDVHHPHTPESLDRVLTPSSYDAEIAGVDRQVGRMLEALEKHGALDDTLVVVTADHGESLGEHGEETHAVFVYESTLHVPLLLRLPKALPQGKVYAGTARGIDLAPTLLEALGEPPLEAIDGKSLWSGLRGEGEELAEPAYSESLLSELGFGMAPLYALRQGPYTLIRAPRPELYDRSVDPGELQDLSLKMPDKLRELDALLTETVNASEKHAHKSPVNPLDAETIESLQALGYLAQPDEKQAMQGMDPKDGIVIYEQTQRLRGLARSEKHEDCRTLAKQILKATPQNISVLGVLSQCELGAGDKKAARATLKQALAVDPSQARLLLQLAMIELQDNKLKDAAMLLDEVLRISPGFVEAMTTRGVLALLQNKPQEAERYYQLAIAADPGFPRAYQVYADLFFRQGDYSKALDYYERALLVVPGNFFALTQAGVAAQKLAEFERSREFHLKAARLRPDAWAPPYNLACLAAREGKAELALGYLSEAAKNGIPRQFSLAADADFESLRGFSTFQALVKAQNTKSRRPTNSRAVVRKP